ncbi:MAG TPA: thiolase domain-containing protein [Armatimonadota bacterium]|jgi:acetyl-CoA C-acetyltransferase
MKTYVTGMARTRTGERWDVSIRDLAAEAAEEALDDAQTDRVGAIVVGNMLSGPLASQENLATIVADAAGLVGVEAIKVEAACASGASAIRVANALVASGEHDSVLVVGVEKMTDTSPGHTTAALSLAADGDYEALHGATFPALVALMMRAYMEKYGYDRRDFAGFSVNAHKNAMGNPKAMLRRPITEEDYMKAPIVSSPMGVMDSAPICDGAAAIVITAEGRFDRRQDRPAVRLLGSAGATDTAAVATRRDPLWLEAAYRSAKRAYQLAGVGPDDIDVFEAHDAFPAITVLALEASGFAKPGQGVMLAKCDEICLRGRLPISTMGGLKARGHPVGATGVYQAVEACLHLRGEGGSNQVENARIAMAQNIGGSAACIVTSIYGRED